MKNLFVFNTLVGHCCAVHSGKFKGNRFGIISVFVLVLVMLFVWFRSKSWSLPWSQSWTVYLFCQSIYFDQSIGLCLSLDLGVGPGLVLVLILVLVLLLVTCSWSGLNLGMEFGLAFVLVLVLVSVSE